MSLETRFNAASGPYSHVTVLEKDTEYLISHLDIVTARCGLPSLASLRHPTDGNFVIFLQKRYASVSEEMDLLGINQGIATCQLLSKRLDAHKSIMLLLNKV
jgi:hypothetical protein